MSLSTQPPSASQPEKTKPGAARAVTVTLLPVGYVPLAGVTVPPPPNAVAPTTFVRPLSVTGGVNVAVTVLVTVPVGSPGKVIVQDGASRSGQPLFSSQLAKR